jgi:uncharacterized protein YegP (UPF0339 family)
MSKFTITIKRNGLYHFVLTDDQDVTLLSSSGYVSKLNCESDIGLVKENVHRSERFELKATGQGECYFNIIRQDGYIIVKSELFPSEAARQKRITLVQRHAPQSKVEDSVR